MKKEGDDLCHKADVTVLSDGGRQGVEYCNIEFNFLSHARVRVDSIA